MKNGGIIMADEKIVPTSKGNSVESYSKRNNTDIYIYSGPIGAVDSSFDLSSFFIQKVLNKKDKKENCLLFLTTYGGNPDAAYKIASILRSEYKNYNVVICGYCKSAGTLICLGASKLYFSKIGEIGPLDIQTKKTNDFFKQQSGLDLLTFQEIVKGWTYSAFEHCFINFTRNSAGIISIDLIVDVATKLSKDLYAGIISKVNPTEIGEIYRALNIATQYGNHLKSPNVKVGTIDKLVSAYPCHSFVIDKKQSEELFEEVKPLDNELEMIYNAYKMVLDKPHSLGFVRDVVEDWEKKDECDENIR